MKQYYEDWDLNALNVLFCDNLKKDSKHHNIIKASGISFEEKYAVTVKGAYLSGYVGIYAIKISDVPKIISLITKQ